MRYTAILLAQAAAWRTPVRSLSPQALVAGVAPTARVPAPSTPRPRPASATPMSKPSGHVALPPIWVILPGRKHGILLDPAVIRGVEAIAMH